MNITTNWDDENHYIIRVTYGRGWEPDVFIANEELLQKMMETVDHHVDVILDLRHTSIPVTMVSYLPVLAVNSSLTQPNAGMVLIVGIDPYLFHLREIFTAMYRHLGRRVILVPTLEDAYAQIESSRARLAS